MSNLKTRDMATPINSDGGRDLGALIGAVTGACLAYWGLPAGAHGIGIIEVLAVAFGAILGVAIGVAIGSLIDMRLTPKIKQTIDNVPTDQRPRNSKMH
jgi:hypothetical protein